MAWFDGVFSHPPTAAQNYQRKGLNECVPKQLNYSKRFLVSIRFNHAMA
jgi:hypothetical protein